MNAWKQKRSVMRRYDSTATIYNARYAEEQEVKYKTALERVKPKGTVLDLGCGTGLFLDQIFADAERVVGIDLSRKQLITARKHSNIMTRVDLVQADAENLPLKANSFDVVYAFTVLQNLSKPSFALKETVRIAKPRRSIVITGLKKVFSAPSFESLLLSSGLRLTRMIDEASLNCYIAVVH